MKRLLSSEMIIMAYAVVFRVLMGFAEPAAGQIVVGNDELRADQILAVEQLIGYRRLSKEFFATADYGVVKVGIPEFVFVDSAKSTSLIVNVVMNTGKNPASAKVDDWVWASQSVGTTTKFTPRQSSVMTLHSPGVQVETLEVDSNFVASFPNTELFPKKGTWGGMTGGYTVNVGGIMMAYLPVDTDAWRTLANSYEKLEQAEHLPPGLAKEQIRLAAATLRTYPFLEEAARLLAGNVSFGRPNVYRASEKGLILPVSLSAGVDVYWVEFAVTFREVGTPELEKLLFSVKAPSGITAVELVPLRVSKDAQGRVQESATLTKGFDSSDVIGVGKVLGQDVAFRGLKPTIVAEGLQEGSFSWWLTDEAMEQPGSKRFVAILRVPKGRPSVSLQLQAGAKTKGKWSAQGGMMLTQLVGVDLDLK